LFEIFRNERTKKENFGIFVKKNPYDIVIKNKIYKIFSKVIEFNRNVLEIEEKNKIINDQISKICKKLDIIQVVEKEEDSNYFYIKNIFNPYVVKKEYFKIKKDVADKIVFFGEDFLNEQKTS